jgi:hypothetical protein
MYKTLVQRQDSKPNQMTKTEPNLLHITHSNTPQNVLKRTSIKLISKCLKLPMPCNDQKMCTKWTSNLENPYQIRNAQWLWDFLYKFLMPWMSNMQKIKSRLMQMRCEQKCTNSMSKMWHKLSHYSLCVKNNDNMWGKFQTSDQQFMSCMKIIYAKN